MKVADLGEVLFGAAYDTTGLKLSFDKSDGNPDSTAVGTWFQVAGSDTISNNHVYAISRGLDELGNPLGVYQVIFDSLQHGIFYFRYAPLSGGTVLHGSVMKDNQYNYIFFSLKSGQIVAPEPPKAVYDLQFTQYTTLLYTDQNIPYPYLVTGVLVNRTGITVAVDSSAGFQSITKDFAVAKTYSGALDAIGYDWKYYSFTSGLYTIRPNLNFIIRNHQDTYYKLRFVGFYNGDGLKGYPMIEFQKL